MGLRKQDILANDLNICNSKPQSIENPQESICKQCKKVPNALKATISIGFWILIPDCKEVT